MLAYSVGAERVLAFDIFRKHIGIRRLDTRAEGRRGGRSRFAAGVCMRIRGKIGFSQLFTLRPAALRKHTRQPKPISAGRRAENAQRRGPVRLTRQRIVRRRLIQRRQRPHGGGEEIELHWKTVAEQTGNAQRHIDAGASEHGQRRNLKAADARRTVVPCWANTHQRKSFGEIVPAGAHCRAAPQIKHDGFWPFAMVLRVARQ